MISEAPNDLVTPQAKTSQEAAEFMIGKKRIVLMTGAGINVASGIPNAQDPKAFLGKEERYGGTSDPTRILSPDFF